MIYVMSDLHGRYDAFLMMLDEISFQQNDILFLLGDYVDRGDQSMKLLFDLMYRDNVYCLCGNHDVLACECLKVLKQEITDEFIQSLDGETLEMIIEWINHIGGKATLDDFKKLNEEQKEMILEFLDELPMYDKIVVNNQTYLLVHTLGHKEFTREKDISEYDYDQLLWERCDYGMEYYKDKILITGHTPTLCIFDNPNPDKIYKKYNHIAIDCGMKRLACLCLDTMEEFYLDITTK
ncbi:metallophosphoesterase [Tannockella kyphosi]|uniref:metallophosphoesterase n=1 Tax=Tannockella kyphosi TaxID=2899121 RepID=UPI00201156B0|nr:metallophosphoesterase [Tannockella kyphosi]